MSEASRHFAGPSLPGHRKVSATAPSLRSVTAVRTVPRCQNRAGKLGQQIVWACGVREEFAKRMELVIGEPTDELHKGLEAVVGEEGDAEEGAIQEIRREDEFPEGGQCEGAPDEEPGILAKE